MHKTFTVLVYIRWRSGYNLTVNNGITSYLEHKNYIYYNVVIKDRDKQHKNIKEDWLRAGALELDFLDPKPSSTTHKLGNLAKVTLPLCLGIHICKMGITAG